MSTVETECSSDGCSGTVRYGVESVNIPEYCSFECRDRSERVGSRR